MAGVVCALLCALLCVLTCAVVVVGCAYPEAWLLLPCLLGGAWLFGRVVRVALLPRWRLSMGPEGLVLTSRLGRRRTVPWTDVALARGMRIPDGWPEQAWFRIGRRRSLFITVTRRTASFIAALHRAASRQGRVNWLDDTYVDVPDSALSLAHLTGEEADADRALSLAEPPVERTNGA